MAAQHSSTVNQSQQPHTNIIFYLLRTVWQAIQTISDMGHNVRPSNPKVYFTSITPLGLKYVLLFYVTDYNDDVSKYKSAVSDALLQIVLILRKLEVDLIAAPAGVVAT